MYLIKKNIKYLTSMIIITFSSNVLYADDKSVWRDPSTGLSWMRCSIGQKWTGKLCTGEPLKFRWQDALDFAASLNQDGGFAGRTDWRVPAIDELSTIRKCSNGWERETTGYKTTAEGKVEVKGNIRTTTLPNGQSVPDGCADGSSHPTLNAAIFPNTKDDTYWSSLTVANFNFNGSAWIVNFYYGNVNGLDKNAYHYVRLVRSSQ